MPRTKVNRNVGNNKRVRENAAEMEEILRELEIEGKVLKNYSKITEQGILLNLQLAIN